MSSAPRCRSSSFSGAFADASRATVPPQGEGSREDPPRTGRVSPERTAVPRVVGSSKGLGRGARRRRASSRADAARPPPPRVFVASARPRVRVAARAHDGCARDAGKAGSFFLVHLGDRRRLGASKARTLDRKKCPTDRVCRSAPRPGGPEPPRGVTPERAWLRPRPHPRCSLVFSPRATVTARRVFRRPASRARGELEFAPGRSRLAPPSPRRKPRPSPWRPPPRPRSRRSPSSPRYATSARCPRPSSRTTSTICAAPRRPGSTSLRHRRVDEWRTFSDTIRSPWAQSNRRLVRDQSHARRRRPRHLYRQEPGRHVQPDTVVVPAQSRGTRPPSSSGAEASPSLRLPSTTSRARRRGEGRRVRHLSHGGEARATRAR